LLTPMQDDGAEHEDTTWDYEHARFCYWEDARQLKSLVDTFASEHEGSVDKSRVMLFGQSSGGTAAMWGAIRSPDVFSHVYAVSPKSFWRPGGIKGCNQTGIQPTNDYDDFLKNSKPLWEKRSKEGTRKLQRLVVFMGTEDLHNGNPDGDTAWDVIPNIITDLKMAETGVKTEFRVFVGLEHRTDAAAFNEGYDFMWKGEQQDDDGWASGTIV
jgi:pimeloyl-ACP methyl ester carboxylesterase